MGLSIIAHHHFHGILWWLVVEPVSLKYCVAFVMDALCLVWHDWKIVCSLLHCSHNLHIYMVKTKKKSLLNQTISNNFCLIIYYYFFLPNNNQATSSFLHHVIPCAFKSPFWWPVSESTPLIPWWIFLFVPMYRFIFVFLLESIFKMYKVFNPKEYTSYNITAFPFCFVVSFTLHQVIALATLHTPICTNFIRSIILLHSIWYILMVCTIFLRVSLCLEGFSWFETRCLCRGRQHPFMGFLGIFWYHFSSNASQIFFPRPEVF